MSVEWQDGTLSKEAYVTIDSVEYEVTPAEYTGDTPVSAYNLNKMQTDLTTNIYRLDITTAVAGGGEVTLPCYYKVGEDCLKVRYGSETLIKASTSDDEGHYYEVGDEGSISNTIKITSDWDLAVGDVLILEVLGVYESEDA